MSEKDTIALLDELARAANWHVESYEQRRASKICRGLPDRRYVNRQRLTRVWVEAKTPGGKLTETQHRWLLDELYGEGLATVIDDVSQLARLFNILAGPRVGRLEEARAYCLELVRLTAQRGYRREAA